MAPGKLRGRGTASGVFLLLKFIMLASMFSPAANAQETGSSQPNTDAGNFTLSPYKPVYALPYAYDRTLRRSNHQLQNGEMKFQFSFKLPIWRIPRTSATLEFGYAQVSFWQAYDFGTSAPFRETNYAPELMVSFANVGTFRGVTNSRTTIGYVHQSNGQSVPLSRSWNRLYADIVLERGNFSLSIKPWYRFHEAAKTDPLDSRGDDNPDIIRYMGYGELTGTYRHKRYAFAVMVRNNLRSGQNHGAVQVDVTGPIHDKLKWYVQYFNGYGESLIDYNRYSNRIGIGVMLAEWR